MSVLPLYDRKMKFTDEVFIVLEFAVSGIFGRRNVYRGRRNAYVCIVRDRCLIKMFVLDIQLFPGKFGQII